MRTIVMVMLAGFLTACSEPVDPREQFSVKKAEAKWNSTQRQWLEAELRQLEYGESLYTSFCAVCHHSSGEGQLAMGAPALKANPFVRGAVEDVARKVLFSKGSSMPPFYRSLDDEQVAAILAYVRNAWGEQTGDLVKPATVAAVRQAGLSP